MRQGELAQYTFRWVQRENGQYVNTWEWRWDDSRALWLCWKSKPGLNEWEPHPGLNVVKLEGIMPLILEMKEVAADASATT